VSWSGASEEPSEASEEAAAQELLAAEQARAAPSPPAEAADLQLARAGVPASATEQSPVVGFGSAPQLAALRDALAAVGARASLAPALAQERPQARRRALGPQEAERRREAD